MTYVLRHTDAAPRPHIPQLLVQHAALTQRTAQVSQLPPNPCNAPPLARILTDSHPQLGVGFEMRAARAAPPSTTAVPRVAHRARAAHPKLLLDALVLLFLGAAGFLLEPPQLLAPLLLLLHRLTHRRKDSMDLRLQHRVCLDSRQPRLRDHSVHDVGGELAARTVDSLKDRDERGLQAAAVP